MKITFLGAAGTVTGSKFLLERNGSRILIDCGLFQGLKKVRQRNWKEFPVDVGSIDAIVLTHAHIDHTGYLPVLVRDGYSGPIYCTNATADLAGILLPDSGRIQEEDAKYANKKGFSRHSPAEPLCTESDARRTLQLLQQVPFDKPFPIGDAELRFRRAGHILGAASVSVDARRPATALFGRHRPPARPAAGTSRAPERGRLDRHGVHLRRSICTIAVIR